MGSGYVEGCVAEGEALLRVDWLAVDKRGSFECAPGQLGAVVRVGAVSAEGEEAVEPGAVQFDVGAASTLPVTSPSR